MSGSASNAPDIAVLLPCYNEAATIGQVVREFRVALPDARIYVYDNNSTDGTALTAMLAVNVFVDLDDGGAERTLWEDHWMKHDGFTVSALIYRTLDDLSARYGKSGMVFPIASRDITMVRQVRSAMPAARLEGLLNGLEPAEIMTLDPWVRIAWRDSESHVVLEVDLPVKFDNR